MRRPCRPAIELRPWGQMIETLLEALPPDQLCECRVLFAGGIHDALSASMVAVAAAPLAERGVQIGVLMGTAYLFTDEAVAGGAIVETFRQEAIGCQRTVLLESSTGHTTRCAPGRFTDEFLQIHTTSSMTAPRRTRFAIPWNG